MVETIADDYYKLGRLIDMLYVSIVVDRILPQHKYTWSPKIVVKLM